jgi:hypothetical protein
MDAWTDEQLNKMKLGGNKRLNQFLTEYEIDKFTPIIEKYHSRAAEVRDGIAPKSTRFNFVQVV